MLATVLSSGAHAALAAEVISENRSVDARAVNIDLDGAISLKVRQGPVASLTLYGEADALKKVTVEQTGDTLHIGTSKIRSFSKECGSPQQETHGCVFTVREGHPLPDGFFYFR